MTIPLIARAGGGGIAGALLLGFFIFVCCPALICAAIDEFKTWRGKK